MVGLSRTLQRYWVAAGAGAGAGVGAWMRAASVDEAEGSTLAGADGEGTFLAISHCTLEPQILDHERRRRPLNWPSLPTHCPVQIHGGCSLVLQPR